MTGVQTCALPIYHPAEKGTVQQNENAQQTENAIAAIPFTLKDQYGKTHTLDEYKGKVIFLNFWATWCPPCRAEMPDIQKLYERSPREGEKAVIVLGVAAPKLGSETNQDGIKAFMDKNGYTYPVLMDKGGKLFELSFNISPSNEHPGLISFRMDWLDLLAVQGTLKSLLQHHSSKASILQCSAFFTVQLSHP